MTSQLPPAGWYPHPTGEPGQMYWDGRQWHIDVPASTPTAEQPTPTTARPQRRTLLIAAIVAGLVAAGIGGYLVGRPAGSSSSSSPAAGLSPGHARVTVAHRDQTNIGSVKCDLSDYAAEITIDRTNHPLAFVKMTQKTGNPPEVRGAHLKYIEGANLRVEFLAYIASDWAKTGPNPPPRPTVKQKGKSYTITGWAWNDRDYHITFEIEVTCP